MARVLLFGRLADVAGWREEEVEADSIITLHEKLAVDHFELGEALARPGVQVAVDRVITRWDTSLSPDSEVAFLPPMSGG